MIWTVVQYPILTSIHLLTFVRCSIQVSTWFANARRRLKKENKMTWEPKNKLDDEDVDVSDDDTDKDKDDDKHGEQHKYGGRDVLCPPYVPRPMLGDAAVTSRNSVHN